MSERTVRTCPECGHESDPPSRSVVTCDNCGVQADKVYSPYTRGLALPEGWAGGFYRDERTRKLFRADLCSWQCRRAFEEWHDRELVRA